MQMTQTEIWHAVRIFLLFRLFQLGFAIAIAIMSFNEINNRGFLYPFIISIITTVYVASGKWGCSCGTQDIGAVPWVEILMLLLWLSVAGVTKVLNGSTALLVVALVEMALFIPTICMATFYAIKIKNPPIVEIPELRDCDQHTPQASNVEEC